MKSIDLFYQGEGIGEIAHIELDADATFAILKARLVEKHGVAARRAALPRRRGRAARRGHPARGSTTGQGGARPTSTAAATSR